MSSLPEGSLAGPHAGGSPFADCDCGFRDLAPEHHDRVRRLESEPLTIIGELVDMAATWHELEYGLYDPVLGPETWTDFALAHQWENSERVYELMLSLSSVVRNRQASDSHPVACRQLASVRALPTA